jgi:hypothetical protein
MTIASNSRALPHTGGPSAVTGNSITTSTIALQTTLARPDRPPAGPLPAPPPTGSRTPRTSQIW